MPALDSWAHSWVQSRMQRRLHDDKSATVRLRLGTKRDVDSFSHDTNIARPPAAGYNHRLSIPFRSASVQGERSRGNEDDRAWGSEQTIDKFMQSHASVAAHNWALSV